MAPINWADALVKKSFHSQDTNPDFSLGIIAFLIKNPKETAGLTCPPVKGAMIRMAANNEIVIYQSYPSEQPIPWANKAVPKNSHQKIFQSQRFLKVSMVLSMTLGPSSFFSTFSPFSAFYSASTFLRSLSSA